MSTFPYKNPLSSEQLNGTQSVVRTSTFGTNFSVLSVGGYMEVYNLSDLDYTVTGTGPIELSGNTIPIRFTKGTGTAFSPDVLTLNSDNVSSGRRKLGMLVYVYETDQIYQYDIQNYETLWNAATGATGIGGATVVQSDFGTLVKGNSVAGYNLISAWTASTIDGIGGYTYSNARWKKYYGSNLMLTGGSYNAVTGTLNMVNITGGTVPIPGFGAGGGGGAITGGTFDPATLELDLVSTGGTVTISGVTGLYITGGTFSASSSSILLYNSTGGTIEITGITISGSSGYYLPLSGGTVTGFTIFNSGLSATTFSASTISANTINATLYYNLPVSGLTEGTGIGITNNNNNFTISYTGATGEYLPLSGGTVTGFTIFNAGLSATTFSASTISANTINATLYYNLPVSGLTGSNNIGILNNNSNFTISLTGGTNGYVPVWTGASAFTNSVIFSTGTTVGINTINPEYSLDVIGDTRLSAETGTTLTVYGTGDTTTPPIINVWGGSGQLMSVVDNVFGTVFEVNDPSGLPVLQMLSNGQLLIGDYRFPSFSTTARRVLTSGNNIIYSIPSSAYTSSFVDYSVSGTTGTRAGSMIGSWSSTTINYTEVSTNDVGDTTPVSLLMSATTDNIYVIASATTSTWIIKTNVRGI